MCFLLQINMLIYCQLFASLHALSCISFVCVSEKAFDFISAFFALFILIKLIDYYN